MWVLEAKDTSLGCIGLEIRSRALLLGHSDVRTEVKGNLIKNKINIVLDVGVSGFGISDEEVHIRGTEQ